MLGSNRDTAQGDDITARGPTVAPTRTFKGDKPMALTFTVGRSNLRETHWVRSQPAPLETGAVRMAIESFALTSNNITYAAFGDAMSYWTFFPTGDPTTGCIPVWGFGNVAESRCEGVAVGERFYGYFPIADSVDLHPAKLKAAGFMDGAPHRRELSAIYNHYQRCSSDALYDPKREGEQALLRPLFTTSFLIDDFLADNDDFGAQTVVLSSASSKTAYGTAHCIRRRRGTADTPRIVGLTSAANAAFTRELGCYDSVLLYEDVASLPADVPTVYVDMSGSVSVRAAVHAHFGNALKYSCSVGGTHWNDLGGSKGLPGPRPVLFFAPAQAAKRREQWGPDGFDRRVAEAWHAFLSAVTGATPRWLDIVRGSGPEAVERTFLRLLDGTVPAREGHVLTLISA
jgi:hypothetical protein